MSEAAAGDWAGSREGGLLVTLRRTVLTGVATVYLLLLAGSWIHDAWGRRVSGPAPDAEGTGNIAPSATMVGARLDRRAREIVVRADIIDPDQESRGKGVMVSLQIHAMGVNFENDLTSASSGTLLIANTVMDAEFSPTPPGTRLELRASTTSPRQLPPTSAAQIVLLLHDEEGGVATCNAAIDLSPLAR